MITNFKPSVITDFKNYNILKKSKQIFCKNFLMYLLLIKYKNNFFSKSSLHFKKYKKKIYTILRSPYRHKLARHQIHINRYFIKNCIEVVIKKNLVFTNWNRFIKFIKFIKSVNKILESNIVFTNNITIFVPFIFEENFLLKYF